MFDFAMPSLVMFRKPDIRCDDCIDPDCLELDIQAEASISENDRILR